MKLKSLSVILFAGVAVIGCSPQMQESSGGDYVNRYHQQTAAVAAASGSVIGRSAPGEKGTGESAADFDALVLKAAAVEPILELPAHIGLARIHRGELTTIPPDEGVMWYESTYRRQNVGRFTLVSPAVAALTVQTIGYGEDWRRQGFGGPIARIRLGAARQHMDAVLIYEVSSYVRQNDRWRRGNRSSVLGATLPAAKRSGAYGAAHAMLIDIRNGYVYGTASAESAAVGSISDWTSGSEISALEEKARAEALAQLRPKVAALFDQIVQSAMTRKRLRVISSAPPRPAPGAKR